MKNNDASSYQKKMEIFAAITAGDMAPVEEKLDNGFDINSYNQKPVFTEPGGYATLLMHAAKENQLEIAAMLLRRGAQVDHENSDQSALECAAFFGGSEMCELLLRNGAQVNHQNYQGATPLHYAALGNKTQNAVVLLKNGADNTIENRLGQNPSDMAGDPELKKFLQNDFKTIVALASAKIRKQPGEASPAKILPTDLLRKMANEQLAPIPPSTHAKNVSAQQINHGPEIQH